MVFWGKSTPGFRETDIWSEWLETKVLPLKLNSSYRYILYLITLDILLMRTKGKKGKFIWKILQQIDDTCCIWKLFKIKMIIRTKDRGNFRALHCMRCHLSSAEISYHCDIHYLLAGSWLEYLLDKTIQDLQEPHVLLTHELPRVPPDYLTTDERIDFIAKGPESERRGTRTSKVHLWSPITLPVACRKLSLISVALSIQWHLALMCYLCSRGWQILKDDTV